MLASSLAGKFRSAANSVIPKVLAHGGMDLKGSPPEWRQELVQPTVPWFNSPVSFAEYLAMMRQVAAPAAGRR
ncbi:MAG: hypothetical protein J0H86_08300 [Xanthomonadaceae bacterium]|nr:hypothetical protein [Xanthomonadaceae bacterium]